MLKVKLPSTIAFLSLWIISASYGASSNEIHEFTLDNGLQILVKEDHRAPVAVSQVWYKIGSSYEQEGKTGLSHLLEHMMFKGTQRIGPGEFSRIMAENGANENAFTSTDYTAYFQTIEKSRLAISFELEADRMRNLRLNADEFAKERQVVIEERRTRTEDKPTSYAYETFMATAYQTSPYHNPIIGWMADLEQITVEDLAQWYRQWYAPNNAVLVVIGDVNHQEVYQLAKKYFGPLQASPLTAVQARPEVVQHGMKRVIVNRPAEVPYLVMGYKAPSLKFAQHAWEPYALTVLAYVLDGGESARFSKNLVRGQAIATSTGASYDISSRLETLFLFYGTPAQNRSLSELEQAIRTEITKVQQTLVDKTELERIKAQLVASEVYELDSMFYQGMKIGMLASIGMDYTLWDSYINKISEITPEQIQAVARKYLVDNGLTVAELHPLPLDEQHPIAAETEYEHQHIR